MEEPGGWERSDAWVLAAVLGACGGTASCSLGEVVAVGDAINHAVFTDAELERGVRRALGAGFIRTSGRRLELTDEGRALAGTRRGGLIGQVDHLLVALRKLPAAEQAWSLEPGELDAASRWWQRKAAQLH